MTLGEQLQKLRQDNNLSLKDLSHRLNVPIATIAEWESDEATPSIEQIVKMSQILNTTANELILNSTVSTESISSCSLPINSNAAKPRDKIPPKSKKFIKVVLCSLPIVVAVSILLGAIVYKFLVPFSKKTSAIASAEESVVKVICYDYYGTESATGSGFIAFNNHTFITNYHVIENAYTCKISTNQDKTYQVSKVLCYSVQQDIAILSLNQATELTPLELGSSDAINKGETVTAIGSPLGIKNTISQGILSGRIMDESMDIIQFTAAISSGSSGGALFDEKGNVIGVTYASYVDGQNLNLAIPIEIVIDLYARRVNETDLSKIYLRNHGQVLYMNDYKDAIDVTMNELKSQPEKYDGKLVKIHSFVSSETNVDLAYISDYEYTSGDVIIDQTINENYDFEMTPLIQIGGIVTCKYHFRGLNPGDPVTVIGEFKYHRKGSLLSAFGDREIYAQNNHAILYAAIIYTDE